MTDIEEGEQPAPQRRATSLNPFANTFISATPDRTVSIKVSRSSLQSSGDTGLVKESFFSRLSSSLIPIRKRVYVEASQLGTNDSIFFAPETPNANESESRVTTAEFIKVRPTDHNDCVCIGDDFEIDFVGMSVTRQDTFSGNDLLLCSLTREEEALGMVLDVKHNHTMQQQHASPNTSPTSADQITVTSLGSAVPTDTAVTDAAHTPNPDSSKPETPGGKEADVVDPVDQDDALHDKDDKVQDPLLKNNTGDGQSAKVDPMDNMPSNMRISPDDIPFIHYDPIFDGHDVGTKPDTFVPMPGTKRLYLQRKGKYANGTKESPVMYLRFAVMEVDKLSEEQLSAIRSIETIAGSVQKAAASIPYLKIVSAMLKFANWVGKTALKKVSRPDHVMSVDIGFKLYCPVNPQEPRLLPRQEEFGNYLRYGYYFFLSEKVDARLYAQTGASTQSVSLLLRRHAYNPWMVRSNEKEYFPITGVSYVVLKVTRGCSPMRKDRRLVVEKHRRRLLELLQKYKSTEEQEAEGK